MQAGSTAQGASAVHPRRRLNVLVAILVIAALVALVMWVTPLATSGTGTEDAIPGAGAGSALIHDDAGSMLSEAAAVPAAMHDDAGNMLSGAGTATLHDDAGNVSN